MAQRAMTSRNGPPPKQAPSMGTPNQTLYLTNLPDKLRKPDLRLSLYTLFSTYGPVLDVVSMKTEKMRGQAFIVYRDVQTSTQAMRALQGFEFFGKEMKITYAKGKSNAIAKLDGTYKMPVAAGAAVATTELQQSIFNAPPSAPSTATAAPPPGLPKPPPSAADANGVKEAEAAVSTPQGTKRARDEESEEEEEADDEAMDEDDSDAPMEASSDED